MVRLLFHIDSKKYWRRDVPFYKAHRKSDREKSAFDWHLIFETLNKLREELKENFHTRSSKLKALKQMTLLLY
jgi:hypothetical protein